MSAFKENQFCSLVCSYAAATLLSFLAFPANISATFICAPINGWKSADALKVPNQNGIIGPARVMSDSCEHDAKAVNDLVDAYWKRQNGKSEVPWHEPLFSCHHKNYPLDLWRQDIPNREVSYLMTHMCPSSTTGTQSWDDKSIQLLDDALKTKYGTVSDFECGGHRGHGVCKNEAKNMSLPCNNDACQKCHDACQDESNSNLHYSEGDAGWSKDCEARARPAGCTCEWIIRDAHGYSSIVSKQCGFSNGDINKINNVYDETGPTRAAPMPTGQTTTSTTIKTSTTTLPSADSVTVRVVNSKLTRSSQHNSAQKAGIPVETDLVVTLHWDAKDGVPPRSQIMSGDSRTHVNLDAAGDRLQVKTSEKANGKLVLKSTADAGIGTAKVMVYFDHTPLNKTVEISLVEFERFIITAEPDPPTCNGAQDKVDAATLSLIKGTKPESTSIFQRAKAACRMGLSDNSVIDLKSEVTFEAANVSVLNLGKVKYDRTDFGHRSGNVVASPLGFGSTTVSCMFGWNVTDEDDVLLVNVDGDVEAEKITKHEIIQGSTVLGSNSAALRGVSNVDTAASCLQVKMTDGHCYGRSRSYCSPFEAGSSELPGLLLFDSSNEAAVGINPATGILTLVDNSLSPITIQATAAGTTEKVEFQQPIAANLDPVGEGDVDIGKVDGHAILTTLAAGDKFDLEVRVNTAGKTLEIIDLYITYGDDIEPLLDGEAVVKSNGGAVINVAGCDSVTASMNAGALRINGICKPENAIRNVAAPPTQGERWRSPGVHLVTVKLKALKAGVPSIAGYVAECKDAFNKARIGPAIGSDGRPFIAGDFSNFDTATTTTTSPTPATLPLPVGVYGFPEFLGHVTCADAATVHVVGSIIAPAGERRIDHFMNVGREIRPTSTTIATGGILLADGVLRKVEVTTQGWVQLLAHIDANKVPANKTVIVDLKWGVATDVCTPQLDVTTATTKSTTTKTAALTSNTVCLNYERMFQGSCPHVAAMALMYAGNGDNDGDVADQASACADSCISKKRGMKYISSTRLTDWGDYTAKGFILQESTGRCWCQMDNSATCTRRNDTYHRYDIRDCTAQAIITATTTTSTPTTKGDWGAGIVRTRFNDGPVSCREYCGLAINGEAAFDSACIAAARSSGTNMVLAWNTCPSLSSSSSNNNNNSSSIGCIPCNSAEVPSPSMLEDDGSQKAAGHSSGITCWCKEADEPVTAAPTAAPGQGAGAAADSQGAGSSSTSDAAAAAATGIGEEVPSILLDSSFLDSGFFGIQDGWDPRAVLHTDECQDFCDGPASNSSSATAPQPSPTGCRAEPYQFHGVPTSRMPTFAADFLRLAWDNGDVTRIPEQAALATTIQFALDWDAIGNHGRTGPGGIKLDPADGGLYNCTPRQAGYYHAVISADITIIARSSSSKGSAPLLTLASDGNQQHEIPATTVLAKLPVKRFGFKVEGQPPFRVLAYARSKTPCQDQARSSASNRNDDSGSSSMIDADDNANANADTDAAADDDGASANSTRGSVDICRNAVGTIECYAGESSYWIAPLAITKTADQVGKNVRLILERAPTGFMIDSASGEIHAAPRLGTERAEPYLVDLVARDESGSKALVETFAVVVVAKKPQQAASASYSGPNSGIAVGIALGAVIGLLTVGLVAARFRAHQLKMAVHNFQATIDGMLADGHLDDEQAANRFVPREIKRKGVTLLSELGKGAFGAVWKGLLNESSVGGPPEQAVAVKTLLDASSSPDAVQELLQEAVVMAQVGFHPNVVQMIGVVTSGEPMMLVLSLCKRGSMLSVLRAASHKDEPLEMTVKMKMCQDVALGMAHLHNKRFLHRDLAARNVLVDADGVCKVADFGLSRATQESESGANDDDDDDDDGDANQYYRSTHGMFPIRWTAPESIETFRFTPASDVWSFGILMYECFRNGAQPYKGMKNAEVMQQVPHGYRLPQPVGAVYAVYQIALQCWAETPAQRPKFAMLAAALVPHTRAATAAAGAPMMYGQATGPPAGGVDRGSLQNQPGYLDVQETPLGEADVEQGEDEAGYMVPSTKTEAHSTQAHMLPSAGPDAAQNGVYMDEDGYMRPATASAGAAHAAAEPDYLMPNGMASAATMLPPTAPSEDSSTGDPGVAVAPPPTPSRRGSTNANIARGVPGLIQMSMLPMLLLAVSFTRSAAEPLPPNTGMSLVADVAGATVANDWEPDLHFTRNITSPMGSDSDVVRKRARRGSCCGKNANKAVPCWCNKCGDHCTCCCTNCPPPPPPPTTRSTTTTTTIVTTSWCKFANGTGDTAESTCLKWDRTIGGFGVAPKGTSAFSTNIRGLTIDSRNGKLK